MKHSKDICPFCQQDISKDISERLVKLFDETYENNLNILISLKRDYNEYTNKLIEELKYITTISLPLLDYTKFISKINDLECKYTENKSLLGLKITSPSLSITLTETSSNLLELQDMIKRKCLLKRKKLKVIFHLLLMK